MQNNLHVHTAPMQKATRYKVAILDRVLTIRAKPLALRWCFRCGKRHRAKNMVVQAFYDGSYFYCADKAKCKKGKRK